MSLFRMIKKCPHCGKRYFYNPSTGAFGRVCPRCKKPEKLFDKKIK